jgi:hypothetical protein
MSSRSVPVHNLADSRLPRRNTLPRLVFRGNIALNPDSPTIPVEGKVRVLCDRFRRIRNNLNRSSCLNSHRDASTLLHIGCQSTFLYRESFK